MNSGATADPPNLADSVPNPDKGVPRTGLKETVRHGEADLSLSRQGLAGSLTVTDIFIQGKEKKFCV